VRHYSRLLFVAKIRQEDRITDSGHVGDVVSGITERPLPGVLSFGHYGRYVSLDGAPATNP
jgi:hypothetical protein